MVTASVLELGNDEVYYFQYAMDLQPNYFDHPPGVAWLIRIFTLNLVLTDEFFIRLGAIVCAAIGTVLSYELGKRIKNERTGWFAAILYTSSIYSSVIAGTFIIPDSPQIVFWLASLLVMHHILFAKEEQPVLTRSWLAFGTLTGLAILCKVHGIFLWASMGLYILLFKPVLLKDRRLYLSAILTVVLISPILLWNIQNDFITYRFHSDRVAIRDSGIHLALRKAYDTGILMTGASAGSLCWFESGTTDSRPKQLTKVECLGWIKGSHCPHYNVEEFRRPVYHELIKKGELAPGYACDNQSGIYFENEKVVSCISSNEKSKSYCVDLVDGKIAEQELKSEIIR